jgi:hypothetical protein
MTGLAKKAIKEERLARVHSLGRLVEKDAPGTELAISPELRVAPASAVLVVRSWVYRCASERYPKKTGHG